MAKFEGIDLLNRFATAFPSTTADGKKIKNYLSSAYRIAIGKIRDNDVLQHSNGWASYLSIP
jgi:hypothetical protein